MSAPLPVAGWYPDPEHAGQDRWWDGLSWSPHRRPSVPAPAPEAAPAPAEPWPGSTSPAYASAPVERNTLALVGFILSMSAILVPFLLNSLAGGIVSIAGLQRSKRLAAGGVVADGRGLSIAGILVGFIWLLLTIGIIVAIVLISIWAASLGQYGQHLDSTTV